MLASDAPHSARRLFSLHWLIVGSVAIVVTISLYKYVFLQDYIFIVEASCDPAIHECYVRDCEIDYCPPNGLATYRVFSLPAEEFKRCEDNSCLNVCEIGNTCIETMCSSQEEAVCRGPGDATE